MRRSFIGWLLVSFHLALNKKCKKLLQQRITVKWGEKYQPGWLIPLLKKMFFLTFQVLNQLNFLCNVCFLNFNFKYTSSRLPYE